MKTCNTRRASRALLTAVAMAALLAACGGSGNPAPVAFVPEPAPTAQVPQTASFSVVGLIGYLNALLQSPADTLEPVDASKLAPPTDDTLEPAPLS
jgi:hypothetical protein